MKRTQTFILIVRLRFSVSDLLDNQLLQGECDFYYIYIYTLICAALHSERDVCTFVRSAKIYCYRFCVSRIFLLSLREFCVYFFHEDFFTARNIILL